MTRREISPHRYAARGARGPLCRESSTLRRGTCDTAHDRSLGEVACSAARYATCSDSTSLCDPMHEARHIVIRIGSVKLNVQLSGAEAH